MAPMTGHVYGTKVESCKFRLSVLHATDRLYVDGGPLSVFVGERFGGLWPG